MPVYEFYCKHCDGVFESVRPMREASAPAPCPVCTKKAQRIPPTSFAAFTMREGYPRAIPDRGTYYHLGKEVKRPITGPVRMNEHPDLAKPRAPRTKSKGERAAEADKAQAKRKEAARQRREGAPVIHESGKRGVSLDD